VIKIKKFLPIIIVAVVLVLGAGAFLFLNKGKSTSPTPGVTKDTTTNKDTGQEQQSFVGSLKDAVSLGVAMKCTYQIEGNEYEGYVKGESYRGSIKTAEGKVGAVIIKDGCMWTWSEDESQGIKTCYEVEGPDETDVWEQSQGVAAPGINYTCMPSAVTDSQFTPPSDVNFMDIDAMMEGFGQ
jgi:hypothetical protein